MNRLPLLLSAALATSVFAPALLPADSPPNVLFLSIDDLRNDLGSYGADHAKTPRLDDFAGTARIFTHHYVQVPTCGASRCALLRARYPTERAHVNNNGIRDTSAKWAGRSLPGVFREQGYETLALGKVGHYPGGLAGENWNAPPEEISGVWDRHWIPDGPWPHSEAIMHGYANGVARTRGESPPVEAHDGPDEAYPDAWVAKEAVATLAELSQRTEPWFFAVGFFKPHLPFAAPKRWHDLHANGVPDLSPEVSRKPDWPSGWHASGEFRRNYGHGDRDPDTDPEYAQLMRRAYAASVSYMDAQIGRVLDALEDGGLAENTIVVVWSDHGFLLGEHAIWGKHCLYEHSLRSPLMIRYPGLPDPGSASEAIVETVDIFPTLAELCRLDLPADLDGRSLLPQLTDAAAPSSKPALGFFRAGDRTLRNERWRLIVDHRNERVELFDYRNDPDETQNHASDHPSVVAELISQLPEALNH